MEFYLLQALTAARASQRIKINHIGIQFEQIEGEYYVSSVLDGYPAFHAGLERSDKITEVDGRPFHPIWSFNQGEDSSFEANPAQHIIAYERGGASRTTAVVAVFENLYDSYRSATANSIQKFSAGNKTIGYVHFWTLSRATTDLVAYHDLFAQLSNTDGLILDLRNSYGYLSAEHLDAIFPSRRSYFELSDSSGQVISSFDPNKTNGDYYGKPIVVLQDKGTAGDMELIAYQIAKLQRSVTIGVVSAGKLGSYELTASQSINYKPGVIVKVDGRQFEGVGNSPDYPVEYPITNPHISDPQYETAMEVLLGIM